jgi:hypothetical protein
MKKDALIHAYPWTLTDPGLDKALDDIQEAGLTGVIVTPHYHVAAYFMPQNPRRKFYWGEAGRAYFVPDESRYSGRTVMRPHVSAVVEGERYFHDIAEKVRARGLSLHFWTVYYFSHDRARDYPQCAKVDALGHVHPSDLNPMSPDSRGYALALTEDLVANYEPDGMYLESLGFHGWGHGFHGMKGETSFKPKDRFLLGLDFSEHSIAAASERGVDARGLRREVRDYLLRSLAEMPDEGDTKPVADGWLSEAFGGRLMSYLVAQQGSVTDLFREVKAAADQASKHPLVFSMALPTEEARWTTGVVPADILPSLDRLHVGLAPATQAAEAFQRIRKLTPSRAQLVASVGWGQLADRDETLAAMKAYFEAGVDGFSFLTYDLLRPYQWETIRLARSLWL